MEQIRELVEVAEEGMPSAVPWRLDEILDRYRALSLDS